MATPESLAVAAAYQQSQTALSDATARIVLGYWAATMGSAEHSALRAAADKWLALAIPIILRARVQSSQLGQAFYRATRRLELPNEPSFNTPAVPELDRAVLTSSLWVTGPHEAVDLGKAIDQILSPERVKQIEGSVVRHTQDGGRAAVDAAYQADPKVVGYYRIEDSDPCYFCAMLMSRGVVFKQDSFEPSDVRFFGPGEAKVHDHCGGSLAPAFDLDPYPGDTFKYHQMWESGKWDAASNRKGEPDVVLGWRQFYDAQRVPVAA